MNENITQKAQTENQKNNNSNQENKKELEKMKEVISVEAGQNSEIIKEQQKDSK